MKINLKNNNGVIKQVKLGISFTFLFFFLLVPLFRGDIKWFFIIGILSFLTCGLAAFYFLFKYNNIYVKELLSHGYFPADEVSDHILKAKKMIT